jgi:LPXTG-site transpeptidase (sortase) family protein
VRVLRLIVSAGLLLGAGIPARAQGTAPLTVGSVPVAIDIPKIGTHAPVVPLGEDDDGTMQSPTDPDTVGWYAPGSGLGAPGNTLLDGHVDWGGRLRVFGLLRQLVPGDAVQITDATGQVYTYNVVWTKLYVADGAPLDEIFDQPTDEEVTLITCGGAFDSAVHMYVSRWVVRAVRTSNAGGPSGRAST